MPQIANQDYSNCPSDYRGMATLSGAIQRGTLFDCVIDDFGLKARPLSIYYDDNGYPNVLYVRRDRQIVTITVEYTPEQYTVKADISEAGCDPESLHVDGNGYLCELDTDLYVCSDGKYIAVTLDDDGRIASYVVTSVEAANVKPVNIPEADLPGLIGLYADN